MTQKTESSCGIVYNTLGDLQTSDLTAVPDSLAIRRHFDFPMAAADAAASFPVEYDVAQPVPNKGGIVNGVITESELMGGTTVFCPFIACGFALELTGDLLNGAAAGEIIDVSALGAAGGVGPAALVSTGRTITNGLAGRVPGAMSFGQCAQQVALALMEAYSLRFMLQCKYEVFSTRLADIGTIEDVANWTGASTSTTPGNPIVAKMNARYKALTSPLRFVLPNRIAALADNVVTEQAPAPTLAATYGGFMSKGKWNGYLPCDFPILLSPCCRFNLQLWAEGPISTSKLAKAVEEATMTAATPIVPEWTNPIAADVGMGSHLVQHMKIGSLDFNIYALGYNIEAKMCREYLENPAIPQNFRDILAASGAGNGSQVRGT